MALYCISVADVVSVSALNF